MRETCHMQDLGLAPHQNSPQSTSQILGHRIPPAESSPRRRGSITGTIGKRYCFNVFASPTARGWMPAFAGMTFGEGRVRQFMWPVVRATITSTRQFLPRRRGKHCAMRQNFPCGNQLYQSVYELTRLILRFPLTSRAGAIPAESSGER